MSAVYDFTVKDRMGNDVSLKDYEGKVLLIVNTATGCGFTPHYDPLEAMYAEYRDKGFEILDFPCNQFADQAPGTDEEIHEFCTLKFGTEFPQFAKIDVNGENADPLFAYLASEKPFNGFGKGLKNAALNKFAAANNKKYGSPRITIELQNRGYNVNKKRVARIMKENGIQAAKKKRRYNSYKGTVGKIATNILDRNFSTTRPYEKLGTDVTVFITPHGKLYLSPVIDFHTREILAYDLSEHPNMMQIRRMLWNLTNKHGDSLKGAILHSDQGWQYQMLYYRKYLKEHSMIQSMSRKGNCLDNSPTENFFGRLKTEMYYDKEYSFRSLKELKENIRAYIRYYNQERIVTRLKTNPQDCREKQQALVV